jgi:hypothetical protein
LYNNFKTKEMKKFNLELTEEQINYVLNVVAQRPFAECHTILADIQAQASGQMEIAEPEMMEVVKE